MSWKLDLARDREVAEDFSYNFEKNTVFEADCNMGLVGESSFARILLCSFLGLYDKFKDFIDSRIEWMQWGVDNNQIGFVGEVISTLALARWFRYEDECKELWKKAALELSKSLVKTDKSIFARAEPFAIVILYYANAHEYQTVVDLYEQKYEKKEYKPSQITSIHRLVYAIALHKLKGIYSVNELQKASIKALSRRMENYWLARGHHVEGFTILKLVWWDLDKSIKPLDVIYKGYDYLLNTEFPPFVDEILKGNK